MTTPTPTRPQPISGSYAAYFTPKSPRIIQYFNRKHSSKISTNDLPMEKDAIGILSPAGMFFASVKMTVPLAYVYILLILWRELCYSFPHIMMESEFMTSYFSILIWTAQTMKSSSLAVEVWAVIEGVFYVILFLHRKWLNSLDTLELSLMSAPMLEIGERAELWQLMMESEEGECSKWVSGWFFGASLETLTKYDVMDFVTWSLFEGRNIEHLTQEEMTQLKRFVADLEYNISIELHGIEYDGGDDEVDANKVEDDCDNNNMWKEKELGTLHCPPSPHRQHLMTRYGVQSKGLLPQQPMLKKGDRSKPKERFEFQIGREDESHHSYFSDLYESYKVWYEENFHPVQDIRNYVAEKTQQLHHAEQSAVRRTSEGLSNMYSLLVEKDGTIDKGLTAITHVTQSQIADAWNSMWMMKERLSTASDISSRRKALRQQLKSYRQTLSQLRGMGTVVPTKQMADLMRKITGCYEALEVVERSAMDSFMRVTGYVGKNLLHSKEPPRYFK